MPKTDDGRPPSLDDLDARLRAAKAKRTEGGIDQPARGQGLSLALRLMTEMVVGVVVGVGIGLGLDYWLGTRPWFLIVFLFLGTGAGILNVYRTASGLGHAIGYKKTDE